MQCTIFDILPSDSCLDVVFSFLDLKDAIRFGEISVAAMSSATMHLHRRRSRLKQRYHLITATTRSDHDNGGDRKRNIVFWKEKKKEEDASIAVATGTLGSLLGGGDYNVFNTNAAANPTFFVQPSVQDRIEQLWNVIPLEHHMRQTIKNLVDDLRANYHFSLDEGDSDNNNNNNNSNGIDRLEVLARFRKVLLASRLHSEILTSAVYFSSTIPMEDNLSSILNNIDYFEIPLSRYTGDILITALLIGASDLGIVEGGPTISAIINEQQNAVLRKEETTEKEQCYRRWVFLHSTILRMSKFTPQQCHRLGIPIDLFCAPQLSSSSSLEKTIAATREIIDDVCFLSSDMVLAFYQFGPLGHSFRGRDILRHHRIRAKRLVSWWEWESSRYADNIHSNNNREHDDILEWLCAIQERARRVRPMTVAPPFVRIDFYTNDRPLL